MPASTCQPGWYISPIDGKNCRTEEKIAMDKKSGEALQSPESSSPTSDAATVQEVRQAVRAEFTKGLKSLVLSQIFTDCLWDQLSQMQNPTVRLTHIL